MKAATTIMLAGLMVSSQVSAQMGMGRGGGQFGGAMGMGRLPQVQVETLIMTPVEDWVAAPATRANNKVDVFMFPAGQDSTNWTEAFQQEAYDSTIGMESATQIYEMRSRGDRENCPNYESDVRDDDPDNGYSTIIWRQTCKPVPDVTFASVHKVILGNDRLYILTKIWKEDPSGTNWRRWENILEDIYVCDPTRIEHHPCRPLPFDPRNATGGGRRNAR